MVSGGSCHSTVISPLRVYISTCRNVGVIITSVLAMTPRASSGVIAAPESAGPVGASVIALA